nr:collagen-like protein [Shrimp white spot syndrome virus]
MAYIDQGAFGAKSVMQQQYLLPPSNRLSKQQPPLASSSLQPSSSNKPRSTSRVTDIFVVITCVVLIAAFISNSFSVTKNVVKLSKEQTEKILEKDLPDKVYKLFENLKDGTFGIG